MKPKPPADQHRRLLLRVLLAGLARVRPESQRYLQDHPEQFELISWTHAFYGSYRDIGLDIGGVERILDQPKASSADIREIDSSLRRALRLWHLFGDSVPLLSRIIARPDLKLTLQEVKRYLENGNGIADSIRAMLKEALLKAWRDGDRVLLIGHSLGSVIAYDTLWELSQEAKGQGEVELLLTFGSPLATRFIRKSIKGAGHPRETRYPTNIRRWVNCSATGEMTALHSRLAPFFGAIVEVGAAESLVDLVDLYNHYRDDDGHLNVHKSFGYLVNATVATTIGDWLAQ